MKRLISLSALLLLLLSGCNGIGIRGSGIVKDEYREIDEFDEVDISGFYFVKIVCGKENSLQIIGDDNLISLIKTEVHGGTLHIWNKKNISPRKKIKINITTNNLENVNTSGASNILVKNISNDKFRVEASGAGDLNLTGTTDFLKLNLSGAVNVNAAELKSNQVLVEISGASNADVYAYEELRADISGVGSIDFYGNPKVVKRRISGLGSITQK